MSKYSISSYVADGSTTDFLITWDYLDTTHITVYVDGTNVSDAGSGYQFALINQTTVRVTTELSAPPPNGAVVELRRATPIDTQAVTFFDGSSLNGEDLNKNTDYLLYAMQEALDTVDIAAQNGAQAAQTATEGFRDEAEGFKNTAGVFALEAQTAATNASNSEAAVAASAAAALQSEINAAGHELVAGTHATDAGNERALAQTAKTEAEAAQTASEAARDASQTAKTEAETAAINAVLLANSAEAAWDLFDDRYLGSKASEPTLDNDGDPLVVGAIYWNSTGSVLQIYNGSSWENVATLSSTPSFTEVNADKFMVDVNAGMVAGAPDRVDLITANTSRVTVDSSGNVGIGTTSPNTKLELGGGTSGQTLLFSNTADNTGARLSGAVSYRTGSGYTGKVLESNITGAFDDIYDLRFFTANTGASAERLRIDSSGNVGIGTDSPSSALEVNGTVTATTVDLGNWTVTEDGSGNLLFATGGTDKMKLDASGNLTVTGNVTAYGSV